MATSSNTSDWTVASLFSGCGGFDIGFQQEGFRLIGAYDHDKFVVNMYNDNVAQVAHVCDLAVDTPHIRPDVLLAGSPCQGFSTAGKRRLDDPRNDLLTRAATIATTLKPTIFILENVPGATYGEHAKKWNQVEALMTNAGYSIKRFAADGPSSGVPQIRKRIFLIAWRYNLKVKSKPELRKSPPLSDILTDVEGLSGHDPLPFPRGSRNHLIARKISPGQKLCNVRCSAAAVPTWDIPEVFGAITTSERELLTALIKLRRRNRRRKTGDADPVLPSTINTHLKRPCECDIEQLLLKDYLRQIGPYIDLTHTYNGKFRRLPVEGISPTVDTSFGNPRLFLHPLVDRGLTPREAARIQGFDDNFAIPNGRRRAFRMIGNAVPPPMGARIAQFVRDAILKIAT